MELVTPHKFYEFFTSQDMLNPRKYYLEVTSKPFEYFTTKCNDAITRYHSFGVTTNVRPCKCYEAVTTKLPLRQMFIFSLIRRNRRNSPIMMN